MKCITSNDRLPPAPHGGGRTATKGRPLITNVKVLPDGRQVARRPHEILSDLLEATGGWPKVARGRLFALTDDDPPRVRFLDTEEQYFAWISERCNVRWVEPDSGIAEGAP